MLWSISFVSSASMCTEPLSIIHVRIDSHQVTYIVLRKCMYSVCVSLSLSLSHTHTHTHINIHTRTFLNSDNKLTIVPKIDNDITIKCGLQKYAV